MAVLSKHGYEIYRQDRLTSRRSYRSTGEIMVNSGHGWKMGGKLKPGTDLKQFVEDKKRKVAEFQRDCPCNAEFKRLFHSLVGLADRYFVLNAIQMLGNDADGLYIALEDESYRDLGLSLDEVSELCVAYDAAVMEANARRAANTEA